MAQEKQQYKRIPGRRFIPFFNQSLWQAEDHLLWVETVFFKQQYKRFYYRDIQTVVLWPSNNHYVWASLWGAFTLIFGLIAVVSSGTPVFSGVMTLFFLSLSLSNIGLGPACRVQLQTAAQVQKLSSLRRMRTSHKAMNLIGALVEEAQGKLEKSV